MCCQQVFRSLLNVFKILTAEINVQFLSNLLSISVPFSSLFWKTKLVVSWWTLWSTNSWRGKSSWVGGDQKQSSAVAQWGEWSYRNHKVRVGSPISCMLKCPWARHWTPSCCPGASLQPLTTKDGSNAEKNFSTGKNNKCIIIIMRPEIQIDANVAPYLWCVNRPLIKLITCQCSELHSNPSKWLWNAAHNYKCKYK